MQSTNDNTTEKKAGLQEDGSYLLIDEFPDPYGKDAARFEKPAEGEKA